jgi:transcriptional regulator of acetoin/glycerol metabolism
MRVLLIDDEEDRPAVKNIRKMIRSIHQLALEKDYEFLGKLGANEFVDRVKALELPPDIAIIDYTLSWPDRSGSQWNGDRVALFLREHWREHHPFYILFISALLRSADSSYDTLVKLLRVPYTGFIDLVDGWETNFKEHILCACDLLSAAKVRLISPEEQARVCEFLGADIEKSPMLMSIGVRAAKLAARPGEHVLLIGHPGDERYTWAMQIARDGVGRVFKDFHYFDCSATEVSDQLLYLFGDEKTNGIIQDANRNAVFIDNIESLGRTAQAQLLRFLRSGEIRIGRQTKKSTVRVISGTSVDLSQIPEQQFSAELRSRLGPSIRIPTLKERRDEIIPIAEGMLATLVREGRSKATRFSRGSQRRLRTYDWPANQAELRAAVKEAVFECEQDGQQVIEERHLMLGGHSEPPRSGEQTLDAAIQDCERKVVLRALNECGWNVAKAAKRLGRSRPQLHVIMHRCGIARPKT